MLSIAARLRLHSEIPEEVFEDDEDVIRIGSNEEFDGKQVKRDVLEAWQTEAASVDRSVRILPGVRRMIDSLPEGRYAVATSGAKTYGKFSYSPLYIYL